jgi:hypothetical protein
MRSDWDEIRALVAGVGSDTDVLVERQLVRIRRELPAYAVLPEAEHRVGVTRHTVLLLAALGAGVEASPADLATGRRLGADRARQGFDVTVVMQAFQVGCSEVWDELVGRTRDSGASEALVRAAAVIWEWVHRVSTAVAEGHAEALAAATAGRQLARWQLVAAVVGDDEPDPRAAEWARQLDLDPQGPFQVMCTPAGPGSDERLQGRVRPHGDRVQVAVVGGLLWAVGDVLGDSVAALVVPGDPVGIGAVRSGLAGASQSAADARRALELSSLRHAPVRWDDDWLWAELAPAVDRLQTLLTTRRPLDLERHAHLVATVRAFAAHGFSMAATARAVSVHPNSVAYRLRRWRELTGWDVQTLDGLLRSLAHIEIAGASSQAPVVAAVDYD